MLTNYHLRLLRLRVMQNGLFAIVILFFFFSFLQALLLDGLAKYF